MKYKKNDDEIVVALHTNWNKIIFGYKKIPKNKPYPQYQGVTATKVEEKND